jgi:limonene-1,2-epoxide hydrolase
VEEFFRKALQETGAEKMLKFLTMECLKWHTDRIPRMYGAIEDKALASLFNTVAQVVIKIRKETQR